jgi:hypothetical protein
MSNLVTLLDRTTTTLYYYKKVISNLFTLSTTQPRLYFIFFLARARRYRSSTYHRHSMSIVHLCNDTHNDKLVDHLLFSK